MMRRALPLKDFHSPLKVFGRLNMNTNGTKIFGQNVLTDALLASRILDAHDFAHPDDVLGMQSASCSGEASNSRIMGFDRNAVESRPELRRPPELSAAIVYQDILRALKALDAIETAPSDRRLQ